MNLSVLLLFLLMLLNGLLINITMASPFHNILAVFPHFGYSHFKVFYPILNGLVNRGHNVTVVTYIKNSKPHPNYHELILTGVETLNIVSMDMLNPPPSSSFYNMYRDFWNLHDEGQTSCELLFKSGYVETLLEWNKKTPFELLITEFFNTDCTMVLSEMLNIPVVGLSSCALMPWYYDRIRLPDTPSYVQSEFVGFPEKLSFMDRIKNFAQSKIFPLLYSTFTYPKDNALIKRYFGIEMDVEEVSRHRTSLILVNQHYTLSGPRPLTPQLIEMGGVHIDEMEDLNVTLSQDIKKFLNNVQPSEKVLFISWGSMVRFSSIDKTKLEVIIDNLQNLPFNLKVIWKWETDEVPIKNEKFLFIKWAPQAALLCHPKIDYFWSHGGLLGTTEAVYCGTPLIVTPIYGDQFLNSHAVQNRGTGVILHYNDITAKNLERTLINLDSGRFTQRAKILAKLFKERDMPPLQKTLWWIESLLKNGPITVELLRTKAVFLHWVDYHSLDVIGCIILTLYVIYYIFKYFICLLFVSSQVNHNDDDDDVDIRREKKKKRN